MSKEEVESGHPNDKADHQSHNERIHKGQRPILDWGYWVNQPLPLLLMYVAALFAGVIVPDSRTKRIYFAAAFIWLILGSIIFWIAHGVAKRHVPTDEEIEKLHRKEVGDALGSLNFGLQEMQRTVAEHGNKLKGIEKRQTGRKVTPEQIDAIGNYLRSRNCVFKFGIRFSTTGRDSAQFASGLHAALFKAGWSTVETPPVIEHLHNEIQIILNPQDSKPITPQVQEFFAIAMDLNILSPDTPFSESDKVPKGELFIWVGNSP